MEALLNSRWPGNIRELENAMERACVTSRDDVIRPSNLPAEIVSPPPPKLPMSISLDRQLPDLVKDMVATLEKEYLAKALKKAHGNVGRCAKISGLSRRSITAKLAQYQLEKGLFKDS